MNGPKGLKMFSTEGWCVRGTSDWDNIEVRGAGLKVRGSSLFKCLDRVKHLPATFK